jgi:serine/threonine protein kinase
MNHLHSEGIVHGDLKAGNVLLKAELRPVADCSSCSTAACPTAVGGGSSVGRTGGATSGHTGRELSRRSGGGGGDFRGGGVQHEEQLVAKVADFGLACRLRDQDTHVSGVHRVRTCGGALTRAMVK